jgi:hypothetical protein
VIIVGTLMRKSCLKLKQLENKELLDEREVEWRMKSRAIWLELGNENTKSSQHFEDKM